MNSAKINIKQKKKKIKQNSHPLYDSDLKRDLNILKVMLNKIRKEKLDFNDRSIESRKKIIAHITALYIMSDDQYQPKHDIQYATYSDLIKYSTLDKWINNVRSLSNKKAETPSGISYEMLKNLNEDNQSFFYAFICVCMDLNDIPDEWKKAIIYPILKLKSFFTNLTNTILITLLKTPQKAFISLLNRHLSRILKNNNVLKGNQFAASPGNSTFEPICTINEIIQYEYVNAVICFQEEVISPLLWCIYYDPLLCEIEQRKLGYTLEAPKIALNKFYSEDISEETEKLTILSSAYMDNTQWFAPSQNNLEKILEIADSYYKLNDIQVNKEKSELLVRYKQGRYRPKLKPHEPVTLSVIIPKIEYWLQVKMLTKKFMDKIMKQFLLTFKKKLHLSITTPDKIFFNKIYNIKDIRANQDQAKITNILIQINDVSVLDIHDNQDQAKITNILIQINDVLVLGRDQLQESFCNIDCTISNTSILYTGQCSTVTRDKYRLIPVDLNLHLHQVINSTSSVIILTINRNIRITPFNNYLKDEDNLFFYTDGSLICDNPTFLIRDYDFRLPNNNLIINNITSIIRSKNLIIRFNKVKAHNNDYFNNQIDQECKIAHYDSTPTLNYKYKNTVDWDLTLWILCNNGEKSETTFEQHHSDCLLCSVEKETFAHVWLCSYQTEVFLQLYNNFKNTLILRILDLTTNISSQQLSDQFDLLQFTKSLHLNNITFLDIIKGFVPTTLVEWLQKYTTATNCCNLLIKALDKLYEDSLDLWKSRCEAVASIENMCGITQHMKCFISYNIKYSEPYTEYNINNLSFDFSLINIEYIEYINLLIRFNIAYIDLFTFDVS
ncbi:reverse transcriptase family protein [Rhizophagus clarus]|uniref:Reverse transcriptase family protein n=1 Tax=Rhizophagus clarus TaxID=94130 RepID=A0A8H3QG36_9GLOM|nr:reverse transcriptase family protein [Rhizophagus clarus]